MIERNVHDDALPLVDYLIAAMEAVEQPEEHGLSFALDEDGGLSIFDQGAAMHVTPADTRRLASLLQTLGDGQ